MKKLFILLLLSISIKSFSQSWTPQSAFWIYEAQFMFSKGDLRLSYVKDTIVQDEVCQLMKLDMIEYNYLNQKYSYRLYGYEVTYYKSGVTYILNNSKFDTLYFFSANTGAKFNITSKLAIKANDSAYAIVADTGQIEVNSVKLKWLALDYYFTRNNQEYKLRDTIIEKIGSTKYYFLPWDFINGMVDGNRGGRLKCYRDSAIGVYNNSIVGDCTFDISLDVGSSKKYPNMQVYPNPAQNEITIKVDDSQIDGMALIYSSTGQIIKKLNLQANSTTIDTRNWSEGLYLIMIQNRYGLMKEKVLIIHNR